MSIMPIMSEVSGTALAMAEGAPEVSGPVVLVTAADARFAMPMCVALHSALVHLDPDRDVLLYVFDDGIRPEDKAHVLDVLGRTRRNLTIEWVSPDLSVIKTLVKPVWHTRTTYLRFLIEYTVPEEHERILYIDSDVVVRDDVSKLWDMELGDYPFWAVTNFEPSLFVRTLPEVQPHIDPAPEGALYCNAGILLMNMPQWRRMGLSQMAIDFLLTHDKRILQGDQDALNGVLRGNWGKLDPRWNIQLLTVDQIGRDRLPETETRRIERDVLADPAILHYTGPYKPWNWKYRGRREDDFYAAYVRSGWAHPAKARLQSAAWRASHAVMRTLRRVRARLGRA